MSVIYVLIKRWHISYDVITFLVEYHLILGYDALFTLI